MDGPAAAALVDERGTESYWNEKREFKRLRGWLGMFGLWRLTWSVFLDLDWLSVIIRFWWVNFCVGPFLLHLQNLCPDLVRRRVRSYGGNIFIPTDFFTLFYCSLTLTLIFLSSMKPYSFLVLLYLFKAFLFSQIADLQFLFHQGTIFREENITAFPICCSAVKIIQELKVETAASMLYGRFNWSVWFSILHLKAWAIFHFIIFSDSLGIL